MEKINFNNTLNFDEFPSISTKEWESKIESDLKGKNYKKVLRWNSGEGLAPLPFYRGENVRNLAHSAQPISSSGSWNIVEPIESKDIKTANHEALHALENGASGLRFVPKENYLQSKNDLSDLLKNIQVELINVQFGPVISTPEIAKWLGEIVEKRNLDASQLDVSFIFDLLSQALLTGKLPEHSALKESINKFGSLFGFTLDASIFGNTGASIVQQLAFALATGNEYLGLNEKLALKLNFNFLTASNYFLEIAKFRAFKLTWTRVLNEYGLGDISTNISAETATWNKSQSDAHNNMLRSTTEAMSAALGGCNSITVHRYDKHFDDDSSFSSRIARNIQLILQEEAYLNKVADPGAGSYYIEVLTESMAEKSWELFQEIEEDGGFYECLKSGFIQGLISDSRQKKIEAHREKEKVLVGVNKYQPEEEIPNTKLQIPIPKFPGIDMAQTFEIPIIEFLNMEAELKKEEA